MTQIGKYWTDGSPYVGDNTGITPGAMLYWNDGAPFVNQYSPSFGWKSFITTSSGSVKSINTVPVASIKSVLTIQ